MSSQSTRSAHRTRAGLALGGLAIGALTAALAVLPAGAAHARVTVPVTCDGASSDEVTLAWDDVAYNVTGVCGIVRITADRAEVTLPTATRVIVEGTGNVVRTKSVGVLVVRGTDQHLSPVSVRKLVLTASSSTVDVSGLLEEVVLTGKDDLVTARETVRVRIDGNHSTVRAARGYVLSIGGDANVARFTRLDRMLVSGDHNRARVDEGRTAVRVTGVDNQISVHRRA